MLMSYIHFFFLLLLFITLVKDVFERVPRKRSKSHLNSFQRYNILVEREDVF